MIARIEPRPLVPARRQSRATHCPESNEAYWRAGNLQTHIDAQVPFFPVSFAYQMKLLCMGYRPLKVRWRHLKSLLRRQGLVLASRLRADAWHRAQARGQTFEPRFYSWLGEGHSIALAEAAKHRARFVQNSP